MTLANKGTVFVYVCLNSVVQDQNENLRYSNVVIYSHVFDEVLNTSSSLIVDVWAFLKMPL